MSNATKQLEIARALYIGAAVKAESERLEGAKKDMQFWQTKRPARRGSQQEARWLESLQIWEQHVARAQARLDEAMKAHGEIFDAAVNV